MGGTRFIGKYLVRKLCSKGHKLTLFTRGNNPLPADVEHIKGDRKSPANLALLSGRKFDVIIDSSGRSLEETENVIEVTGHPGFRFLYVSSAGIYKESYIFPVKEDAEIDSGSRHIGKFHTEEWLINQRIPFTSFRPTYIYGPGNYNPIEKWFFDRIVNKSPIPIPGDGSVITQLGHVDDLASAMTLSLESESTENKLYNCSGNSAVTFLGLVNIAAQACGVDPKELNIISFDPSKIEPKARKAFPLRIENFFTDISLLRNDLNWQPKYDLYQGFIDSFNNDYLLNQNRDLDLTSDSKLFEA